MSVRTAEELLREMGIKWDPTTPECRDLAQRLHDALAEVERLRAVQEVGIAMVTLDLRLRAEAAEAEVERLRAEVAALAAAMPSEGADAALAYAAAASELERLRAEAAEAKLRDTYCARCHERMYP
jgi:hypothetical protein